MIKKLFHFFSLATFYLIQSLFKKRIKPRVIQMPITDRCNSRCVTCKIWETQKRVDTDSDKLKHILSDPFFSKVEVIGINGGEPSLYKGISNLVQSLFVLKNLKRLHFISNGLLNKSLLSMMESVIQQCRPQNIRVYLTISIDGVGKIHDQIRGISGAFDKTTETLKLLMAEKERYCDVLDVGCTLSQKNIAYVVETELYLKSLGLDSYYHPAVPNKRLHNFNDHNFSLLENERSRLLACEYFYYCFKKGDSLKKRLRSFLTFYYLLNHGNIRLAGCNYLRSDVTITESLRLYLCATASDEVGDLNQNTASEFMKSKALDNQAERTVRYCNHCVHYIIFPTLKGLYLFLRQILCPGVWIEYKLKALWLKLL